MEKSKRIVVQVLICIGLLCVIWEGYFLIKENVMNRIIEPYEDDFTWVYQVDSAEVIDGQFVLNGFAFELDADAVEDAFEIVLRDIEEEKKYFLKTEFVERKDVNEYFFCEYDYLKSGFKASIKEKKLKLDENDYEVLLRKKGERTAYKTGTYPGAFTYLEGKKWILWEVSLLPVDSKVYGVEPGEIVGNVYGFSDAANGILVGTMTGMVMVSMVEDEQGNRYTGSELHGLDLKGVFVNE